MKIPKDFETVASIASRMKNKVNLGKLCKGRDVIVTNYRLKDGSTIKLLEGQNEVDCIVMKNGKVLTAKGIYVNSFSKVRALVDNIIYRKIANRPDIVDINQGVYI